MNRQNVDLGSGKVSRLLFSLALPTITSQIVNLRYNLVDRVDVVHMQPVATVGMLAPGSLSASWATALPCW